MTQSKSIKRGPLKPLPYGGDRKPGDPAEEEIKAMTQGMAGRPVWSCEPRGKTSRVRTHGTNQRTQRDG